MIKTEIFQEPVKNSPSRLQIFSGKLAEVIPRMLSGKNDTGEIVDVKRTPMSIKQLIYERLHNEYQQDRNNLRSRDFNVSDIMIFSEEGGVVGLYSNAVVREIVNSVSPAKVIKHGDETFSISAEQYEAVKKGGFFIDREFLLKLAYSQEGVYELGARYKKVKDEFWEFITEGDKGLLGDYINLLNESNKNRDSDGVYGKKLDFLGLLFNQPGFNFLGISGIYSSTFGSCVYNNGHHNLIGIAKKLPAREYLETKVGADVVTALDEKKPFKYNGTIYVPVQGVNLEK